MRCKLEIQGIRVNRRRWQHCAQVQGLGIEGQQRIMKVPAIQLILSFQEGNFLQHGPAAERRCGSPAAGTPQQKRHGVLGFRDERFEANTWGAFWRTAIDDIRATEVAEELGMTAVAVRKAKSRVLHKLKDEFGYLLE